MGVSSAETNIQNHLKSRKSLPAVAKRRRNHRSSERLDLWTNGQSNLARRQGLASNRLLNLHQVARAIPEWLEAAANNLAKPQPFGIAFFAYDGTYIPTRAWRYLILELRLDARAKDTTDLGRIPTISLALT